jgi:hypothetical protein
LAAAFRQLLRTILIATRIASRGAFEIPIVSLRLKRI